LSNLLPVCPSCNGARGKETHFPVEDFRVHSPDDTVEKEGRLLLSPYYDDPHAHLYFPPAKDGTFFGTVTGISKKGKMSVKIYNLQRVPLQERRRKAQEDIIKDLQYYLLKDRKRYINLWRDMHNGVLEFSAAVLSQARSWWKELNACTESAHT